MGTLQRSTCIGSPSASSYARIPWTQARWGAMRAVWQARLEPMHGSIPDQLCPPPPSRQKHKGTERRASAYTRGQAGRVKV